MRFTPLEAYYLMLNNFIIDKKNKARAYKASSFPKNIKEVQVTIIKTPQGYYKEFYDSWTHPYPPMRSCLLLCFNECLNLNLNNFYLPIYHFNKKSFLEECREAI